MTKQSTRQSMTQAVKFDLMMAIKDRYVASGQTDTEFAAACTKQFGITVAPSTVKHYREGFGIAQTKSLPVAALRARIRELEAQLTREVVPA